MQREHLLAVIAELVRAVNWADDKQLLWLRKRGEKSWQTASIETLESGIEYMEKFKNMFTTPLAELPPQSNNASVDETDLRIYLGEDGET